jgi:hypothetical protein
MGVFQDLEIVWQDQVKTVKSNRVMQLIAQMEEVFTLPELQKYAARGTIPLARLSMAYGVALRFAGFSVEDDDIYEKMFSGDDDQEVVAASIMKIMVMMLPQSKQIAFISASEDQDGGEEKEPTRGNSQPTRASLRQRTKLRSGKAA